MSEKIAAALTAKEWEKTHGQITAHREGAEITVFEDGQMLIDNGENVGGGKEFRHALAALALYGQPFGFTHEDLIACENGISAIWTQHSQMCQGDSEECGCGPESRALHSLADRIQALLPPEKK